MPGHQNVLMMPLIRAAGTFPFVTDNGNVGDEACIDFAYFAKPRALPGRSVGTQQASRVDATLTQPGFDFRCEWILDLPVDQERGLGMLDRLLPVALLLQG